MLCTATSFTVCCKTSGKLALNFQWPVEWFGTSSVLHRGQEELRWSASCSKSWAETCEGLHCPLRHTLPGHSAEFYPSGNSPLKCFCRRPAALHRRLPMTSDNCKSCSRLGKAAPALSQEHALQWDPSECFLEAVFAQPSLHPSQQTSLLHLHHAKWSPHDLKYGGDSGAALLAKLFPECTSVQARVKPSRTEKQAQFLSRTVKAAEKTFQWDFPSASWTLPTCEFSMLHYLYDL